MEEETKIHLFQVTESHLTWNHVQAYFTDCFHFLQLIPQTAIFGFHNIYVMIFQKLSISSTRKYEFLSFNNYLNKISKIKEKSSYKYWFLL